jgi:hypothetical protein
MKMPSRRARRTDSTQSDIVEGLRAAGYLVEVIEYPFDLLVQDPNTGGTWLVECKSARGRLTPTQERLIAAGWRVAVARCLAEAMEGL